LLFAKWRGPITMATLLEPPRNRLSSSVEGASSCLAEAELPPPQSLTCTSYYCVPFPVLSSTSFSYGFLDLLLEDLGPHGRNSAPSPPDRGP